GEVSVPLPPFHHSPGAVLQYVSPQGQFCRRPVIAGADKRSTVFINGGINRITRIQAPAGTEAGYLPPPALPRHPQAPVKKELAGGSVRPEHIPFPFHLHDRRAFPECEAMPLYKPL